MNDLTNKQRCKLSKNEFIKVLGKEYVKELTSNNWVEFDFERTEDDRNHFIIKFLERDWDSSIVIHFTIHYDVTTNEWWSENCVDIIDLKFASFGEMRLHYLHIEDAILHNGFNRIFL